MFRRGFKSNFTKERYVVSKMSKGSPNLYSLVDREDNDEPIWEDSIHKNWSWPHEWLLGKSGLVVNMWQLCQDGKEKIHNCGYGNEERVGVLCWHVC